MEFAKWVQTLIDNHTNPCVKFEVVKTKIFHVKDIKEEKEELSERIQDLKRIVSSVRIDRRCARCKTVWLPDLTLGRVDYSCSSKLAMMGFQNKTGRFIYPEEALFMLETNRTELFLDSKCLNIKQATNILIKNEFEMQKYIAYRKLALKGNDIRRVSLKNLPSNKRSCENESGSPSKVFKKDDEDKNNRINFDEVFARLREKGPKFNNLEIENECDYNFKLNKLSIEPDHSLKFMNKGDLDEKIGCYKEDKKTVYGILLRDIVFFRFRSLELPNLET